MRRKTPQKQYRNGARWSRKYIDTLSRTIHTKNINEFMQAFPLCSEQKQVPKNLLPIQPFLKTVISHHLWNHPDASSELYKKANDCLTNDLDAFYKNIRQIYIEIKNKYSIEDQLNANRGKNRVKSILRMLKMPIKPNCYLDIGCLDGHITSEMGKALHINKLQTHGIDIHKVPNQSDEFTFTECANFSEKFPYTSKSIGFITCLMTAHHIPPKNLHTFITEIFRVLKYGGFVVLREHDVKNDNQKRLLDTMHDFYDNVWNPSASWRSDDIKHENANYKSADEWRDLFKSVGFTQIRMYKKLKKNPFLTHMCVFRKNTPKQSLQDIYRILAPEAPREKYRRRTKEIKDVLHWGQRKLLLTEIEFLTIALPNLDKRPVYVIYAGSAPGTHIIYLSKLFPHVHFELYDPREFSDFGYSPMINTHVQYFLDETAREWISEEHSDKNILFISDIRTGDTDTMGPDEIEERVKIDHEWQQSWYRIIKPQMAMFKFRLPWDDSFTTYLDGDIYIQPYPPCTSTETRLIVNANAGEKKYDNKAYEEQMFHFNNHGRIFEYKNTLSKISQRAKNNLRNTYDYAVEVHILEKYLQYTNYKGDIGARIVSMSRSIDKSISNNRTLLNRPVKKHKKTILLSLQQLGYIPLNCSLDHNAWETYIIPRYDWFVEQNLINLE